MDEKQRKNKGMTSAISSLVKIWKISHSYPGSSFVWKIRIVYFSVKHSYLCNKIYIFKNDIVANLKTIFCDALKYIMLQTQTSKPKISVSKFIFLSVVCSRTLLTDQQLLQETKNIMVWMK